MIEAVNSVVATTQVSRGNPAQQSSSRASSTNTESVQQIAQAPYVSPYISVDLNFDRAVLQIRDSETGDVVRQFPTESQLEAYRRAQTAQQVQQQQTAEPAPSVEASSGQQQVVQAPAPQAQTAPTPQPQQTQSVSTEA